MTFSIKVLFVVGIIFLQFYSFTYSQNSLLINDSIIIKEAKKALTYLPSNPDTALIIAKHAYSESKRLQTKKGEAYSLYQLGYIYKTLNKLVDKNRVKCINFFMCDFIIKLSAGTKVAVEELANRTNGVVKYYTNHVKYTLIHVANNYFVINSTATAAANIKIEYMAKILDCTRQSVANRFKAEGTTFKIERNKLRTKSL
jgi:hypothetical protein